jgi:hypothetical protein
MMHTVTLSNGRSLSDLQGSAHIRSRKLDEAPAEAIGSIYYSPASRGSDDGVVRATEENYSIFITVPEEHLQRLIDDVQSGHPPTAMTVSIEEMGYDIMPESARWELDRKDRSWKPGDSAWLPVERFSLEYGASVEDQQLEEAVEAQMRREAREVGHSYEAPEPPPLSPEVQAMRDLTSKVETWGKWVVGLLVALVIAAILRK